MLLHRQPCEVRRRLSFQLLYTSLTARTPHLINNITSVVPIDASYTNDPFQLVSPFTFTTYTERNTRLVDARHHTNALRATEVYKVGNEGFV